MSSWHVYRPGLIPQGQDLWMSLLALRSHVSYLSHPGLCPYYLNIKNFKKEPTGSTQITVSKDCGMTLEVHMSDQHKAVTQRWRKAIIIFCNWLIKGYFCHLEFWENQESYSQTFTREILEIREWKRLNNHRLSVSWVRVKRVSFSHPPNSAWGNVNQDISTFFWSFLESDLLGDNLTGGAYCCGLSDVSILQGHWHSWWEDVIGLTVTC